MLPERGIPCKRQVGGGEGRCGLVVTFRVEKSGFCSPQWELSRYLLGYLTGIYDKTIFHATHYVLSYACSQNRILVLLRFFSKFPTCTPVYMGVPPDLLKVRKQFFQKKTRAKSFLVVLRSKGSDKRNINLEYE